ncbi:hypothetical protein [Limnofasciculus baicalensis]|uniref:Uncharacterized protein n=1 Tax=Limnofasciculus baicalensis BBK-W-15 TaxID=2699891 RepID=A0AAE3GNV7_9CYAN|nr:hypothetical protein [Limnofasciculus baicalensis]MCP2727347.1 hypothetical protein [Limnofasciculus baicalensis BBK-W-15]
MTFQLPFMTTLEEDADFSLYDSLNAVDRLFAREKVIAEVCEGSRDPSDLLDLFSDQGMDTDAYLEEVEENVNYLLVYPSVALGL